MNEGSPMKDSNKMGTTNGFAETDSPFKVKKNTLYQPKPDFYATFHCQDNTMSPKQIRKQRMATIKKNTGDGEKKEVEKKAVMTPQSLMIS